MFSNVPNSDKWSKVEPLLKGWSDDKKYIVYTEDFKYLLRVSDISLYNKRLEQFNLLKEVDKLELNTPKPISFGKLNDNEAYMLLSYVEGKPAQEYILNVTDDEAYKLGIDAGNILKKLHSIKVNIDESWYEKYKIKANKKIEAYLASSYKLDNSELILSYYKDNLQLMRNREYSLTHGDYHLGNMVVDNGKIGIIDFDKMKYSDSYDDFKPYYWSVSMNKYFEIGLIDGYFNNNIPDDFFKILKYYTAEVLISHLPWAVGFGDEEIKVAYEMADNIFKWYDNFKLDIPVWYKKVLYK